jgi:hypothetical protein
MQKYEVNVTVQTQQSVVIDPVLKPGMTATSLDVVDVTPMVTVNNPTLGHVLERQRIDQLPINGRLIGSLLQTVPGMEGTRAYGLRDGSHEWVMDGAAQTDKLWDGGGWRRPPGLDTIQEFKVENNNSSAKFTRPTTIVMSTRSGTNQFHGAVFETHRNNAIGKARARQDSYSKAPQLIRNEFGASAGAPVILPGLYNGKDKTFWFFAYEGFRLVSPSTGSASLPTEAMRSGDMRGLMDSQGRLSALYDPWTTDLQTWERQPMSYAGKANVIDPARISPLTKHLFDIIPFPTHPDRNPLIEANWWGLFPLFERHWTTTTRVDQRFTDNDQLYARYTQGNYHRFRYPWPSDTVPTSDGIASTVINRAPNRSLAVSWVRTFSPTLFNELVISGSREHWTDSTGEPGVKYADQLALPNPLNVAGWPQLYDTGLNFRFATGNPQASAFTYYILDDNATKIVGKHELQFGLHFRYDQLNYMPDQQHNQGSHSWGTLATSLYDPKSSRTNPIALPFTGHNLANMYLGVMNYSNQFVRGYFYMRGKEYATYIQDNWRLTPRLTLNLGLRWEFWPPYAEKNRMLSSFDRQQRAVVLGQDLETMYRLGATIPSIVERVRFLGVKFISPEQAGLPEALINNSYGNFGPRLGFAYRAGEGPRSFVLRGGFRTSYFPIPMYTWGQRMRMNVPLTHRFTNYPNDPAESPDGIRNYLMRSVPTVIAGKNSRDAVKLTDAAKLTRGSPLVSHFASELPDARVHDWNLTFEKEVMTNTVARIGYVGNYSDRLEQFYRYNEPTPDYIWFVTTGQQLPGGEYSGVARRFYDQQVYGTIEEFRKTGWSRHNGIQLELERRYSRGHGFQLFYNVGNTLAAGGQGYGGTSVIPELNQFLPGAVPADMDERNGFLNYQRDTSIPKHRVRWNWIVDLPFGKGKSLAGNAGPLLDRIVGGWQIAGLGSLRSNYFALPTGIYPNGNGIEIYGYKYPIQDCRSGTCLPGYLWWNGYIPANQINSVDPVTGKPNGFMGVPSNYKPAGEPLIPWPQKPDRNDPMFSYFGGNTVWVPLKDGTVQRTGYNDNLHPWRQQYYPGVRQWGLDASLFKIIPINERLNARFNADFFNVLNMPGNPNSIGSDGMLRTNTSGQGARQLQLTLRLTW